MAEMLSARTHQNIQNQEDMMVGYIIIPVVLLLLLLNKALVVFFAADGFDCGVRLHFVVGSGRGAQLDLESSERTILPGSGLQKLWTQQYYSSMIVVQRARYGYKVGFDPINNPTRLQRCVKPRR